MPSFDFLAFVKTHGRQLEYGLLALIIFTAGYQTGRLTAPYYASTPIVFQDVDGQTSLAGDDNLGDVAELEALQDAGQQLQVNTAAVAGTNDVRPQGQYVASVNSDLFHDSACPSVSRIKPENQVWFTSIEEAQAAGYQPSKCTLEKIQK